MPEMNGIDALIAIHNEFPDARVIVLTTYESDTQFLRALKAGELAASAVTAQRGEVLQLTSTRGLPSRTRHRFLWVGLWVENSV